MELSRLKIGNEDFLVASMIDRCPKVMMLRELVKNAIEAAEMEKPGERRVEISSTQVDGARKLSIWNTGPGMDGDELFRMCDIASSIRKENALDQNFGMGAKVASLPSNQYGIRYRSCKSGKVHQVLMGKRDGLYGRVRQKDADGELQDVIEVTPAATADGRDLNRDWTEVVLLGNHPDQDTLASPYENAPQVPAGWIAQDLYSRFYRLPDGVDIILHDGTHLLKGVQHFHSIQTRMATSFDRVESVEIDQGIVIHYLFDAPDPDRNELTLSARNALQPGRSGAATIFRNEIYDIRRDWAWTHEGPLYGFPFGSRNFSVYIALPDDYPVAPDAYRQFLRYRNNEQMQVETRGFAKQVNVHRPDWVLELLSKLAPDSRHTDSLRGEVATLFSNLKIRRRWWPAGKEQAQKKPEAPHDPDYVEYEVAPQISVIRDIADIRERGLERKAARYYGDTHQLFVNANYDAVSKIKAELEAEFINAPDEDEMRKAALVVAEQVATRLVCRKLVFSLGKRGEWAQHEIDQSLLPPGLSLAADDYFDSMKEARKDVAGRLGLPDPSVRNAPTPQDLEHADAARKTFAEAMEGLLKTAKATAGDKGFEVHLNFK